MYIYMYAGVSLSLSGVTLLNNSFVDVDDIARLSTPGGALDSDNVLLCRTDLMECCHKQQLGSWHYPNGSRVDFDVGSESPVFRRNRGQKVVRLWRRSDPSERGCFHCELPNTDNITQTISVNICKLMNRALICGLNS